MQNITLIVAMGTNRVIGVNNTLPWHLRADLQHFKANTLGKTIVMGRKTYESIGRPLPGRETVVLTRDAALQIDGVQVIHSVDALSGDIVVVGGEQIYTLFLPHANKLLITEVKAAPDGDAYFPGMGSSFTETSREHHKADDQNDHDFDFVTYIKGA
jgi:dihydrofolate reductase